MNKKNATVIGRGVRAPDFVLPLASGVPTRFYAKAGGRPAVVVFASAVAQVPTAFIERWAEAATVHLLVESGDSLAEGSADIFLDDGSARSGYGISAGSAVTAIVLDANLRVLGSGSVPDAEAAVDALIEEAVERGPSKTVSSQAPVLFVPRALPTEVCDFLMALWERSGHVETGVEHTTARGREDVVAGETKRREDHIVSDDGLIGRLTQTVGRRVLPELEKAFAFRATRFEGFKIACYDARTGGFFHAHRDNLSPSTAHRRFAMSLNLCDDYDGGELRFPEYGNTQPLRAGKGDALVFGCGVLHEVVPVSAGRRFALLSFLFNDETARVPKSPRAQAREGFDPFKT